MKYNIRLEQCARTDYRYQQFRNRHYVENHGCIGQQLHYLIFLDDKQIGIISGASATFAVKPRDEYFGITKENKYVALPSIINNVVYRIEDAPPNCATQILAMWRKQIAKDWEKKYNVKVHGFETFVVENDTRKGALYKADNWDYLGETKGSAKVHKGNSLSDKSERKETCKKLIFCKKIRGTKLSTEYNSIWNIKKKQYEKYKRLFVLPSPQ